MTVHIAKVITLPDNLQGLTNLADARIGASIVSCSDEFFASAERMLQPEPAKFIEGKFDDHGKWMDGWERKVDGRVTNTRRRRRRTMSDDKLKIFDLIKRSTSEKQRER